jgi:hypothetical protein
MYVLFDPAIGTTLACFLALMGYWALRHDHPDPDEQRRRKRAAHTALATAALISGMCAVLTTEVARGLILPPAHHHIGPLNNPVPTDDFSKLAGGSAQHDE